MKIFLKWAAIFVPAIALCFAGFGISAGLGVLMALGSGSQPIHISDPLVFAVFTGVFILPLLILGLSTFVFLKITRKINMSIAKRNVLAFFWIPLLIVYYLILLAPSLLIWLVVLMAISAVIALVKRRILSSRRT